MTDWKLLSQSLYPNNFSVSLQFARKKQILKKLSLNGIGGHSKRQKTAQREEAIHEMEMMGFSEKITCRQRQGFANIFLLQYYLQPSHLNGGIYPTWLWIIHTQKMCYWWKWLKVMASYQHTGSYKNCQRILVGNGTIFINDFN